MTYIALQDFPYCPNGVDSKNAVKGKPVLDLPEHLIPGLEAGGFIAEAGGQGKSLVPDTKNLGGAPENKNFTEIELTVRSDEELRAYVEEKTGAKLPAEATRDDMMVVITEHAAANGNAGAADDDDELTALRIEYRELAGKSFYHGWDADELRTRIAKLKAGTAS